MKKTLLTLAAALCCWTAFSQEVEEADESNFSIDLNVIGRLDAVGEFPLGSEEKPSYNSGNSVLYTKIESNFAKYFNITWVRHLLATSGAKVPFYGSRNEPWMPTKDLYYSSDFTRANIWGTSSTNWTDFLYLDFNYNGFNLRVGKDCLALGGFEYDKWDWEVDYATASTFWLNNASYQWGGQIGYTTPSEKSTFVFQLQSSPLTCLGIGEEDWASPWKKGIGSYSFKYTGEYGPITTSNSYNFLQSTSWKEGGEGLHILAFGVSGNIADVANIGVEWVTKADNNCGSKFFFRQSQQVDLIADWQINDFVGLDTKIGWEKIATFAELSYDGFDTDFSRVWGAVSVVVRPIPGYEHFKILGTLGGQRIKYSPDDSASRMNATLSLLADIPCVSFKK